MTAQFYSVHERAAKGCAAGRLFKHRCVTSDPTLQDRIKGLLAEWRQALQLSALIDTSAIV